jgi:hypothetical protein
MKIRRIAIDYIWFLGLYSLLALLIVPLLFSFSDDKWYDKIATAVLLGPIEVSSPFFLQFIANSILWFLVIIGIGKGIHFFKRNKNITGN